MTFKGEDNLKDEYVKFEKIVKLTKCFNYLSKDQYDGTIYFSA